MKTFKEYLQEMDLSVSFNPEKEKINDVIAKTQQVYRKGAVNPQRVAKEKRDELTQQSSELKKSDDAFAIEKLAIKNLEIKLGKMKQLLAAKEDKLRPPPSDVTPPSGQVLTTK